MILDARGNPVKIEKKSLGEEFASFVSATGQSYDLLPDPDPVLRKKGDDAQVLDALAADDQVVMAIQLRKRKVLVKGDYGFSAWQQDKGTPASKAAESIRKSLEEDLRQIKLKTVFSSIVDANFYGYSVFELFWRRDGNHLRLTGIVEKPRHWFGFDGAGQLIFFENGQKRNVPPGKFLVVQHEPTYQNPYGLRLLSRCLWPVAFKQAGVEWTMRFLEKYGMPWQIAKAPQSYDIKKRQQLAVQLASMVQDAVAVLPHGAEHTLTSTSSSGDARYLDFLNFWNAAISKVLSCQTQSSEITGTGTYASSKTHYDVLADVAQADELLVCDTMNDLSAIYAGLNNCMEPPVFSFNEAEDYAAQAELDKKRYAVGVRFTKAHFTRYGLDEDEFYLQEESHPAPQPRPAKANHTQVQFTHVAEDELDAVLSRSLDRITDADANHIASLKSLILEAEDYDSLLDGLIQQTGSILEQGEILDLMDQLLVAAGMFGRYAVLEEGEAKDAEL